MERRALGRSWRGSPVLALLLLTAAGHTLWIAAGPPPGTARKIVGNVFFLLPYLFATLLALGATRQQTGPFRRAWAILTAGLACWAAGQAAFLVLDLRGAVTFPSVADIGFVLLPLLFTVGIFQFFRPPASRLERLSFVLDLALLVVTFANLLWTDYVTASWSRYAGQSFALLVATAYPVSDILMIAMALAMALWSPREAARNQNALLGLGIGLFLWASVGYGLLVSRDAYTVGGWLDLTWSWAAALFGLAAVSAAAPQGRALLAPRMQATLQEATALLLPLLPYVAVVVSFLLALLRQPPGAPFPGSGASVQAVLVAVLALLRFLLTETHNRRLTRQLDHQAHHDALTGALGRSVLHTRLPLLTHDALRRGETLAVLFTDLDRFKQINDSFGHDVGDRVLVQVAARLRRCLGPSDLLIRMGGDEFVVLLRDVHDRAQVEVAARRLLDALRPPLEGLGLSLSVSASVGVARLPADTRDLEEAVRFADLAMYHAKRAGRGNWRLYHAEWQAEASERFRLERAFRAALGGDCAEFQVHYQPVLEAEGGGLRGFEALVRWTSPEHGPVSPTRFIPLAEESGQIGELGAWVLREALRQLRRWREHDAALTVAVNISAVQFRQEGFVASVLGALEEHHLPGAALTLELTESSLLEDLALSRTVLHQLRERDIGLALDDFGTGYSSLAYLRDLPVGTVKIDRSFIWALDEVGAAIVRSIVDLARQLGLRVVAEGVETGEQLRQVQALGCHDVQGFLLARPLPADEATAFLIRHLRPMPNRKEENHQPP